MIDRNCDLIQSLSRTLAVLVLLVGVLRPQSVLAGFDLDNPNDMNQATGEAASYAPDESQESAAAAALIGPVANPANDTSLTGRTGTATVSATGYVAKAANSQAASTAALASGATASKASEYRTDAKQACAAAVATTGLLGTLCLTQVAKYMWYSYKANDFGARVGVHNAAAISADQFHCATDSSNSVTNCAPNPAAGWTSNPAMLLDQRDPTLGDPSVRNLPSNLRQISSAGFSIDPNRKAVVANGKVIKSNKDFGNYFKKYTGQELPKDSLSDLSKQTDKIFKNSEAKVAALYDSSAEAFSSVAGASRNQAGRGKYGTGASGLGPSAMAGLGQGQVQGMLRSPSSVSGMTKNLNGEPIGVSGDDIFMMINRRYLVIDRRNELAGP